MYPIEFVYYLACWRQKLKALWKYSIIASLMTWGLPALSAPTEVGNGGDGIRCQSANHGPAAGFYSLDYLATLSESSRLGDIATVADPLARIRQKLLPILQFGRIFDGYVDYSLPQLDSGITREGIYQWQPLSLQNFSINDESLLGQLPDNCVAVDALGRRVANISQLVVRNWRQSYTLYYYDRNLVSELRSDPLQFSFLMVHEFLWQYVTNADAIRSVNRFLHSTQIDSMTPVQLEQALRAKGVNLRQELETDYTDVYVDTGANGKPVMDHQELWFRWPNWLVSHHIRVHNRTADLLLLNDFGTESMVHACYPRVLYSQQVAEVNADVNKAGYFWVGKQLSPSSLVCPAEADRAYVYVREQVGE